MPRGLELLIAQTILQGFDAQYGRFLEVTSGAQQRFEHADWHAVQQAMKQRIHLYDHHVGLVVEQLRCITDGKSPDAEFLLRVKEHYTHLLPDYPRFEIAESFFNSVYCRLFDHRSLSPERLFIFSSQPERRFRTIPRPLAKDFFPDHGWEPLLHRILTDLPLRLPWPGSSCARRRPRRSSSAPGRPAGPTIISVSATGRSWPRTASRWSCAPRPAPSRTCVG